MRVGNPALAPEMSNLMEMNHLLPFWKGKATWLTSAFARYTTDVITSYARPLAEDSTVLLNTFINGSTSTSGGWENVFKVDPIQGLQPAGERNGAVHRCGSQQRPRWCPQPRHELEREGDGQLPLFESVDLPDQR